MSGSVGFGNLGSAPVSKTYASVGADLDLIAENPRGTGQPPRWFRIGAPGDLALEYGGQDGPHTDTIPGLVAGENVMCGPSKILAATTATNITVFW